MYHSNVPPLRPGHSQRWWLAGPVIQVLVEGVEQVEYRRMHGETK